MTVLVNTFTGTCTEDPAQTLSVASLDHPMSDEYEIMPYAYTDGYDKIEDVSIADINVPIQFPVREGPLPTPGYNSLLSQQSAPTVYKSIENYEQPLETDSENIEPSQCYSPSPEQCKDMDKSVTVEHSVKAIAKPPAYIQLISETEEDSSTVSNVLVTRDEIEGTSADSPNKVSSSYPEINYDAEEDNYSEEIPSSYLKISEDIT